MEKYSREMHLFNRCLEDAATMFPGEGTKFRLLIQPDYNDEFGVMFGENLKITQDNIDRLEEEMNVFVEAFDCVFS